VLRAILTAPLLVHLVGPASSTSPVGCFLRIAGTVEGGGSSLYCLESFTGRPGPGATVRDSGTMIFTLPRGTITASVKVVQRFARDGKHATQTLTGTVVGGTLAYQGAHGAISGGGTDTETAPGRITSSDLRYRILLSNRPR
jgi:hypothetical protein